MAPVVPAELAFAGDGTPFSPAYGDVYHSSHGGLEQARHVFLAGNGLPARWRGRRHFTILETGFGLGLNFLATWQAWKAAGEPCRLHFVSVEKHPFRHDDLAVLLARFPELATEAAELLRQWPPLTPGFHRLHVGRLSLTLLLGDAAEQLPRLVARADAIYLDGFAPGRNPELWSPALLATLTRLAAPEATLATWSVAGELRRSLDAQGWRLERRPGFAGKREMLTARRATDPAVSPAPTFATPPERRALVIGGGLAGAAVADALARRDWTVTLLERHDGPAQEASGNPAGILLPRPAKDDALGARLSRACYLHALGRLAALPTVRWSACGVLQLARDAAHEALQAATVAQLGLPPDFAAFLDREIASALVGRPLPIGGWWFPGGAWVNPPSLCAALLAATGIETRYGQAVAALRREDGEWRALDAAGNLLAAAPQVVLANAWEASRLLPAPLPLTPVRGQISVVPPETLAGVRQVICRSGYLTPPEAGTVCVGASFDSGDTDLAPRLADHEGNLRRLDEMLPGAAAGIDANGLAGRVGLRSATPDRLPLAGPLPDLATLPDSEPALATLPRLPGLHGLLGLGARGMVWAPLAAELLACRIEGEPLPLERELADAVDPARFHLRALRRGKAKGL